MKEGIRVSIGDGSISAHVHFTLSRHPSLKDYEAAVTKEVGYKRLVSVRPVSKPVLRIDRPVLT